jgi:hypothetical protein
MKRDVRCQMLDAGEELLLTSKKLFAKSQRDAISVARHVSAGTSKRK